MVIKMQAVVEVPSFDAEWPPPWPVASMPAGSWLALTTESTDQQVGLFAAALAYRLDVAVPGGRDEVVDTLLAEEFLVVPGGLRLVDTGTGMVVVPGCCAGLEDWRDWVRAIAGESPWLGAPACAARPADGGAARLAGVPRRARCLDDTDRVGRTRTGTCRSGRSELRDYGAFEPAGRLSGSPA